MLLRDQRPVVGLNRTAEGSDRAQRRQIVEFEIGMGGMALP